MKGYTLIELLATIVILSVIILIATPVITGVIETVKKSAFESSAKNILKAGVYTHSLELFNPTRELVFTFSEGIVTGNYSDAKLEFSGEVPKSGNLIIREDGKISASLFNGKYCAEKSYNESKITISEKNADECFSKISLPEIILNGEETVNIEINTTYVEDGVIAKKINGESITEVDVKIFKSNIEVDQVDTSKLGNYEIVYTVVEGSKTNYLSRMVNVIDTIPPLITIPSSTSIVINQVTSFNFLEGVSVSDNSLENIVPVVSGSISKIAGSYEISYSAKDSSGNETIVSRIININDIDAPLITLNGSFSVVLNVGDAYTELGATATDDADGDITNKIIKSGTVNTNVPGIYFVIYTSTDSSKNESSVTRTVSVLDNVKPSITFSPNGGATPSKTKSTTVTVTDNVAISTIHYEWTSSITAPTSSSFSKVLTNGAALSTPSGVTGLYYLWIKAVDNANNEAIVRSESFNIDNSSPTVSFSSNGNSTYAKTRTVTINVSDNIQVSSIYYEWTNSLTTPSFTKILSNGATISTPTGVTGLYYLWIKAVDNSGNEIVKKTDPFYLDNTNPVITTAGNIVTTLKNYNSINLLSGVSATDSISGNLSINYTGSISAAIGNYTITYRATDSSGNEAQSSIIVSIINDNFDFNNTGNKQIFVVPATGNYVVTAFGAEGGTHATMGYGGGKGAVSEGIVYLIANDQIEIVVGTKGGDSTPGGGGGATYIYNKTKNTLISVAGGGGGSGSLSAGQNGQGLPSGSGNGGTAAIYTGSMGGLGGGGGGGFLTSGANANSGGIGGGGYAQGSAGGTAYSYHPGIGGYGGGGGAGNNTNWSNNYGGGGGGGGYTGGHGGGYEGYGGGGGTSYITSSATNQLVQPGVNLGNGKVKIIPIISTNREFEYKNDKQIFVVPITGIYTIKATGAEGGKNTAMATPGAKGASIEGKFNLSAGDEIEIVVAGRGKDSNPASGGGGSYVYNKTKNTLLLVAGGGGGSSSLTAGQPGSGLPSGSGNGGTAPSDSGSMNGRGGGGGGGFLSSGATAQYGGSGGKGFMQGSAPGDSYAPGVIGGYGGGGGAGVNTQWSNNYGGSGGGGGYTGGHGGGYEGYGGGGGTSYILPSATSQKIEPGVNVGNGLVTITK